MLTGPRVGVLAVVRRAEDGAVLLVKRANDPDKGKWGYPGGKVAWGEPLFAAAERELAEETGIRARAERVLHVTETIDDAEAPPRWHYVLAAVACVRPWGDPVAADDADDVAWVAPDALDGYDTCRGVAFLRDLAAA